MTSTGFALNGSFLTAAKLANHTDTTHPPFLHSVVSQGGIISEHISSWCCVNTILIFSISLLS